MPSSGRREQGIRSTEREAIVHQQHPTRLHHFNNLFSFFSGKEKSQRWPCCPYPYSLLVIVIIVIIIVIVIIIITMTIIVIII